MVNTFLDMQIKNMIVTVQGFEQACQIAALQDDGKISKAEEKTLCQVRSRPCRLLGGVEEILNNKNTALNGWYFCVFRLQFLRKHGNFARCIFF